MPRKAATVSEDSEPKKKTTKKAATTTVKKAAARKTAEVEPPAAAPVSTPEPAPLAAEAEAPTKAKRVTRKKAAPAEEVAPVAEIQTEAPAKVAPVKAAGKAAKTAKAAAPAPTPAPAAAEPVPEPAPVQVPETAEEPKKPRGKKAAPKKAAKVAPAAPVEEPAQGMLPLAAAPESQDWRPSSAAAPAPAPVPVRAPAPVAAAPAPVPQDYRPRPLYISREVEAFLRAANIPLPTEKAQLDAIMNAMSVAKAAAQAAAAAYAPAPVAPRPVEQGVPAQAGQPGQPGGQPPQQRQQRDPRDQREHRDPRQRDPRHPRDQRDPRHQQQGRENRENRDNREPRESAEARESREAAEYAEQLDPNPPKADEPVEVIEAEGYCEISGKGFGFLRDPKRYFLPSPADVFVTPELVKRFGLRDGHWLTCSARKNSRGLQVHRLHTVNGQPPENVKSWPSFEDLTTISPLEHIKLETVPERTTTRVMDLMTPIGKGQRGLIVAPPRTGKTTLLNHIAEAVVKNHPDMKLIILLVDERPEEVTDFKRAIPQAELWASSNDMDVKSHTRIATLAIERARRLVESGADVFVLMDSITRMGRAFNNALTGGGRTMSGGVDARALEMPRKIFAAARNTEEAGSLTIVATALIDTGSRMDELIFQEFKGTGNCEIVLDRKISDQRVYPAIDIFQSGTRREELILPADALHKINIIRRGLSGHKPFEAIERMLSFLKRFPTNAQLLKEIPG